MANWTKAAIAILTDSTLQYSSLQLRLYSFSCMFVCMEILVRVCVCVCIRAHVSFAKVPKSSRTRLKIRSC